MAINGVGVAAAFTDQIKVVPYKESVVMQAVGNKENFQFSFLGEETKIREFDGVNAKDYNGKWTDDDIDLAPWTTFTALVDRKIDFGVQAKTEMDALLQGLPMAAPHIIERSWAKLGAEVDAYAISTYMASVPKANVFNGLTDTQFSITPENALNTLNNLEGLTTENLPSGMMGIAFISQYFYQQIRSAIATKNFGFASGVMMEKVKVPRLINSAATKVVGDGENAELEVSQGQAISIDVDVYKYGRLYLYVVPTDRMINKIIMLDGETAGQTAGGWVPKTADAGFKYVHALVFPQGAVACGVRHIVSNFTTPVAFMDETDQSVINDSLAQFNEAQEGVVTIKNIGIDQLGDKFKYMNRILYGAPVFGSYVDRMYAIVGDLVTGITASAESIPSAGETITITLTGTNLPSTMKVDLVDGSDTLVVAGAAMTGTKYVKNTTIAVPANATGSDKVYYVKANVGTAGAPYIANPNVKVTVAHA